MVQRTRRRMAAVFSMIAGFWFTLSGGPAQAYTFYSPKQPKTVTTKASVPSTSRDTQNAVPSTGRMLAPAPDANNALNGEVMTVYSVGDASMQNFMYQKALEQNMNPEQLSPQVFNALRTDFLLQRVNALETQLQQINGQNLSH